MDNLPPIHIPPLTWISNAPPIMAAPNPTAKHVLTPTKKTHSRTHNNILGSVPPITNTELHLHGHNPPPTPLAVVLTRHSPRALMPATQVNPTQIPQVCYMPIDGGLQQNNIISQEAINFLTKCVWSKSTDIYMPHKLHPTTAPSCLDLKQVAMPMVPPTIGETISSYKRLMHDLSFW